MKTTTLTVKTNGIEFILTVPTTGKAGTPAVSVNTGTTDHSVPETTVHRIGKPGRKPGSGRPLGSLNKPKLGRPRKTVRPVSHRGTDILPRFKPPRRGLSAVIANILGQSRKYVDGNEVHKRAQLVHPKVTRKRTAGILSVLTSRGILERKGRMMHYKWRLAK